MLEISLTPLTIPGKMASVIDELSTILGIHVLEFTIPYLELIW